MDTLQFICPDSEPVIWGLFDPSIAPSLLYYSYLPIIFVSLFLGVLVLLLDKGSLRSRLLLWITVVFSLYLMNELIHWIAVPVALVHFSWQITALFHVLMALLVAGFITVFLRGAISTVLAWTALGLLLPVALATPTLYNIAAFDLENCEGVNGLVWEYVYLVQLVSLCYVVALGAYTATQTKAPTERIKAIVLATGCLIFLGLFTVTNIIGDLTLVYDFNLFGPVGMVAFLATITYLIVRYGAFGFRLLGAQALVGSLLALLFAALFVQSVEYVRYVLIGTAVLVGVIGWLLIRGVKREVEARHRIETLAMDLKKANDRLKELDQMKSEFLSVATHQLRAPLTAMRGYASLIAEGSYGAVAEGEKEPLFRIMESGRNMANSIEDYLNVSRIEQGRMKFESASFDLTQLADTVVKELTNVAERRNLKLILSPSEPVTVKGDIGKIKQVMTNYIDNAIKYTPQGSITVKVWKEGEGARFAVEDTGTGIAADELPKLFSKFTRARDANKVNTTGTGLGLYVAKILIEGHKGKTWAESVGIGRGSRFIFEIPV